MKIIFGLSLFLLVFNSLYAIDMNTISEIPNMVITNIYMKIDDDIIIGKTTETSYYTYRLDTEKNRFIPIPRKKLEYEMGNFYGTINNKICVAANDASGSLNTVVIDPRSEEVSNIDLTWTASGPTYIDYQNGYFFANILDEVGNAIIKECNLEKKQTRIIDSQYEPILISEDKMHMILKDNMGGKFIIWNVQDEQIEAMIPHPGDVWKNTICFVTNELLLVKNKLYSTKGKLLQALDLRVSSLSLNNLDFFIFNNSVTHCIATIGTRSYLLDAGNIKEYLIKEGLFFVQRPGICTSDRVRIREYPNLDSKTQGYIEDKTELQVLSRSGRKQTIDPWGEEYWYEIKQDKSNLKGWVFGAFLDFDEMPGDRPGGVELPAVDEH